MQLSQKMTPRSKMAKNEPTCAYKNKILKIKTIFLKSCRHTPVFCRHG